jgi:hypothetical protein
VTPAPQQPPERRESRFTDSRSHLLAQAAARQLDEQRASARRVGAGYERTVCRWLQELARH